MHHDPISDLLTRIRNAKLARHRFVDFPLNRVGLGVVRILEEKGFVEKVLVDRDRKLARIYLKYLPGQRSTIQGLKRVSSPGCRRYIGYKDVPNLLRGLGVVVMSTPKGIIDGETARREKVGGEVICHVW